MSSGVFRGKESSNRIELSRLVQDLLNFGVLGSLRLWGGGAGWMGVGGGWGVPPHMCTCTHMHACTRTHTHAHACVVNMIIPCKWLPRLDLGKSQGFPMMSYVRARACACVRARACAHVWGAPSHHPPPPSTHLPTPQGGDPRNQSKFNSTSTN